MNSEHKDKVALVTGGAQRVGAGIVRYLHARGWRVLIHYRGSESAALALAAELNARRAGSAAVCQLDLLHCARLPELVAAALTAFGRLDAVINNASAFFATPVGQFTEAAWDALIGSNLKAPLFLAQAAAPALAETGGSIVSIADIHVDRPCPGLALYSVAKAGLVAMTRGLARELAPRVRVNAVAPGANLWPDSEAVFTRAERERIEASIPLGRTGTPEDLAQAILFLLEAPYLTGVVLPVDGGRSVVL
ncbi:pteridine reductase [Chitiniphilus eburneus]|uniref:Pteridine reductase n=1 Tax=Chitiniphilus eburneus TaxID=2571148 RepID=A0A4U0PTH0_9NEIS|nr:pteridine reductase [Chitiniphilus eburneus]TJZ71701.1 pteridine reductase [Chitiniphilus eburneus]